MSALLQSLCSFLNGKREERSIAKSIADSKAIQAEVNMRIKSKKVMRLLFLLHEYDFKVTCFQISEQQSRLQTKIVFFCRVCFKI